VGFSAGLILAVWLVGMLAWRDHFLGWASVALAAAAGGKLYSVLGRRYADLAKRLPLSSDNS
jgi:hypothetical protein